MRPTAAERARGRVEVARLRVAAAERRAPELGLDPATNPRVLEARRTLATRETDAAAYRQPAPEPRHRRDVDGHPEE